MNYESANNQLQGRNKVSRKLGNNTYLIRLPDNSIAVKLHNTNVVTFLANGDIILNSGNWHTPTTKDRINSYSGFRVSQKDSRWTVYAGNNAYAFNDGMVIHPDFTATNCGKINLKNDAKFKANVKKFAQLCASKIPLEHPGAGDCFYCQMVTDKNENLGDAVHDTDHLLMHMKEHYVVPSMVFNAMVESGYKPQQNIQFSLVFDNPHNMRDLAQDCVKNSVYKYILKRFGYAL